MEIPTEEGKLKTNRTGLLPAAKQSILGIVLWLDWLFTLTDEDRLKAGINLDGEGHEKDE
jgi:hypothetical protein